MKKLIAIVALSLSMGAQAADKDLCNMFSHLAETAMKARQNNVDLQQMLSISSGNPAVDKTMHKLLKSAYSRPRYHTEDAKQDAIRDFKNGATLTCMSN